jgi:uncharacterized membrane protein
MAVRHASERRLAAVLGPNATPIAGMVLTQVKAFPCGNKRDFNLQEATMWWWNDYYWRDMPWVFGPLMMFFLMALCMGMMFLMMRFIGGHGWRRKNTAEMLNESFVRGEISESQYRDLKRILEG